MAPFAELEMSNYRLSQLRSMLAEDPGDVFLRYAIALELRRRGEDDAAHAAFKALLTDEPGHLPSYYQLTELLAEIGRIEEARNWCERGIEESKAQGQTKVLGEFQSLLDQLDDDA